VRLVDDDGSVLPRDPRTTYMQAADAPPNNLYADAYIRPTYDEGGTAGADTHTVDTVLNTESASVYDWGSRANNSNNFWVVYILGAMQDSFKTMTKDMDPNSESGTGGSSDPAAGGSLVYFETIRERGPTATGGASGLEDRVVTHEVGHAMTLDHGNGTNDPAANGIMNPSNQLGPTGADLKFIDRHLDEMRDLARPR